MNEGPDPNGHGYMEDGSKGQGTPRPEYIILDGEYTEEQAHKDPFDDISSISKVKIPWAFRILFIFLSVLSVLWLGGGIIAWSILSLADFVTFYKFPELDSWTKRFWQGIRRALALGSGFLVSILSPSLGLGFIMLYCLLHEDKDTVLAQMVRANFTKFSR